MGPSKKYILAGLFSACTLVLILLFSARPETQPEPSDLGLIDNIVLETLAEWRIEETAVSYTRYPVGDRFTRREAVVIIHPSLPSTLMHARIARRLRPSGIQVMGVRYFPENTLKLDFIIYDTLVYSLIFETSIDPEEEQKGAETPDIVPK